MNTNPIIGADTSACDTSACDTPNPSISQPAKEQTPPAAAAFAEPEQARPRPVYEEPDLHPGAVVPTGDSALARSAAGAQDAAVKTAAPAAPAVSKAKLAAVAIVVIAAATLGLRLFDSPAPAPVSAPVSAPAPAPVGTGGTGDAPQAPATPPPAPGIGIDIGDTASIAPEAAEFELLTQWRPVAAPDQHCRASWMSPVERTLCEAVTPARFYQCAPDGEHWNPLIDGCNV